MNQPNQPKPTHVLVPVALTEKIANFFASEVPWGKANPIMGPLSTCRAIRIDEESSDSPPSSGNGNGNRIAGELSEIEIEKAKIAKRTEEVEAMVAAAKEAGAKEKSAE